MASACLRSARPDTCCSHMTDNGGCSWAFRDRSAVLTLKLGLLSTCARSARIICRLCSGVSPNVSRGWPTNPHPVPDCRRAYCICGGLSLSEVGGLFAVSVMLVFCLICRMRKHKTSWKHGHISSRALRLPKKGSILSLPTKKVELRVPTKASVEWLPFFPGEKTAISLNWPFP